MNDLVCFLTVIACITARHRALPLKAGDILTCWNFNQTLKNNLSMHGRPGVKIICCVKSGSTELRSVQMQVHLYESSSVDNINRLI